MPLSRSLAVLAVVVVLGLSVFGLYGAALAAGVVLTPADRALADLADALRAAWAVEAARRVTDLGSFAVLAPVVLVTAVLLLVRRGSVEAALLLLSFVLVWLAVDAAKDVFGRPRPGEPLVFAPKTSFPSGHAAQSTTYVALAVLLARGLPGLAPRAALLAAGVALAGAVGLSRIYLRVHYWSDVAAGWGLGFAIFAAGAVVALVVVRRGGRELGE